MSDKDKGFEKLILAHRPLAARTARSFFSNIEDILDAVAFCEGQAWRRRVLYDTDRPFAGWYFTLAKRVCGRMSKSARLVYLADVPEPLIPATDGGVPCVDDLVSMRCAEAIIKAISDLPQRERLIVQAYFLQEMSVPEIAAREHCSQNTIEKQLGKARALVRSNAERRLEVV